MKCPNCNGKGFIDGSRNEDPGINHTVACPNCVGTGLKPTTEEPIHAAFTFPCTGCERTIPFFDEYDDLFIVKCIHCEKTIGDAAYVRSEYGPLPEDDDIETGANLDWHVVEAIIAGSGEKIVMEFENEELARDAISTLEMADSASPGSLFSGKLVFWVRDGDDGFGPLNKAELSVSESFQVQAIMLRRKPTAVAMLSDYQPSTDKNMLHG